MKRKLKSIVFTGWISSTAQGYLNWEKTGELGERCAVMLWKDRIPEDDDRRVRVTVEFLNDYQSDTH